MCPHNTPMRQRYTHRPLALRRMGVLWALYSPRPQDQTRQTFHANPAHSAKTPKHAKHAKTPNCPKPNMLKASNDTNAKLAKTPKHAKHAKTLDSPRPNMPKTSNVKLAKMQNSKYAKHSMPNLPRRQTTPSLPRRQTVQDSHSNKRNSP